MNSHATTPENSPSGKEVVKQVVKHASRFSSQFWFSRVFRPTYTRPDGTRAQVAEWAVRIQYSHRRESVGLSTNHREEASRRAAHLYQMVRSKGWQASLAEFRPQEKPRTTTTVGDYLTTVQPFVKVRDRSFGNYAYALRKIAIEATGGDDIGKARFDPKRCPWRASADKVELVKLTTNAVEKWKAAFIAAAGDTPLAIQRARRSVNSYIRNARALFKRRVLKRLADLSTPLPDPLPFRGVELEREGSTRYVSTIDAGELLKQAQADLAGTHPEAWKVILLALGVGLRRGEIDMLGRQQIDFTKSVVRILTTEHFDPKTDNSASEVFVDAGLLAQLKTLLAGAPGLFVVEPATPAPVGRQGQFYRCAKTFKGVTAWLRAHGVLADKPLHTLRKEFGSILTEQSDIHTASRQLRHSKISTTAAYYADHRRRATVPVGQWLERAAGS